MKLTGWFFGILLLMHGVAGAAVWFVDKNAPGPGEDGTSWATAFRTIQPAIDAASAGDDVWVAQGIYVEVRDNDFGTLEMKAGVDLFGGFLGIETARSQRNLSANVTTIDGSQSRMGLAGIRPAFNVVTAANDAALDGFTVTGGSATVNILPDRVNRRVRGGGMYAIGVSFTVRQCVFRDNVSSFSGAAVFAAMDGHEIEFEDCEFVNNESTGGGPAFDFFYSGTSNTVRFGGCDVVDNPNEGLFMDANSIPFDQPRAAELVVEDCRFENNEGRTIISDEASVTLTNTDFLSNGGTAVDSDNAPVSVTNSRFISNSGSGLVADGPVEIVDSRFANQTSTAVIIRDAMSVSDSVFENNNRAIENSGSDSSTISNCDFLDNKGDGSAVDVSLIGGVMILDSRFHGNVSRLDGGAIRLIVSNALVARCTFMENRALNGGALNIESREPPTIASSIFANNSASLLGGAIASTGSTEWRLLNNTFVNNRAQDGGAIHKPLGPTNFVNSIVADNLPNGVSFITVENTVASHSTIQGGFPGVGNLDLDPLFRDAANGDFRLRPDSPLIDAGTVLPEVMEDIDGVPRPQGASHDIGAFEFQDTDGDGAEDAWEIDNGFDPNNPADSAMDADGDGIPNQEEFRIGSDPRDAASPAARVFVSKEGDDETGDGSEGSPWASISKALEEVGPAAEALASIDPLTVNIGQGVFAENVAMAPFVTLAGASTSDTVIEYPGGDGTGPVVTAAEQSRLNNLTLTVPSSLVSDGIALVEAEDVDVELDDVILDGRNALNSVGAVFSGPGSSASRVTNSVFRRLNTGVQATDSAATVSSSTFENIRQDAVFVGVPPTKGLAGTTPNLGAATIPGSGANVFRNVAGFFVLNLVTNAVRAENNDWGFTTQEEIAAKVFGNVDFVPFVGMQVPPEAQPQPVISVQPGARDFGDVEVGDTADATVTVTNDGEAPLNGSARAPQPFFVVSGSPYNIPVGESVDITIRFAPEGAHEYTGTVIFSGGGGATAEVSGEGFVVADDPDDDGEIPDGMKPAGCSAGDPHSSRSNLLDALLMVVLMIIILLRTRRGSKHTVDH